MYCLYFHNFEEIITYLDMNMATIISFYCLLILLSHVMRLTLGIVTKVKNSEVNLLCNSVVYGTEIRNLATSGISQCFMVCMTEGQCKSCTYNEESGICTLNSGIVSSLTTCAINVKYAQTFECHETGSFKLCNNNLHTGSNEITGYGFVYTSGLWGTICDDSWETDWNGEANANVLCKSLGYSDGTVVYPLGAPNTLTNDILMDEVMCTGTETNLLQCPYITNHDCEFPENIRVKCVM